MDILTQVKKNKKNYELIINGNKRLIVSSKIFYSLHLKEGQEIDLKQVLPKVRSLQEKEALQRSIYMLSLQDRCEMEIIKFLKKQHYADSIIKYVLDRLKSLSLLDDKRYIERHISNRLATGYGEQRIIVDLIKKGFNKATIESALQDGIYEEEAFSRAVEYAKKYSERFDTLDYNNKQKIKMALLRRGFSYDIANKALDKI
ncbi:MAG: RecX family transcriptional regulator [Eubacteriales bacterium]|nr:RecX family transcriptional regulator [Eubacteriales bacterium]